MSGWLHRYVTGVRASVRPDPRPPCVSASPPLCVAFAFGRRHDSDTINRELAVQISEITGRGEVRTLVTQADIARHLPANPGGEVRVMLADDLMPLGEYVSTDTLAKLAAELGRGGEVGVVCHVRHRARVMHTLQAYQISGVLLGMSHAPLDRHNEQWWVRSVPAWALWECGTWARLLWRSRREAAGAGQRRADAPQDR